MAPIEARLSEANVDLCRLAQDSRSVVRQAAPMTCAIETVEPRPVKVQFGGGQWACNVSGHAEHLQPSGSRGRLRHREPSEQPSELVPKKVKPPSVLCVRPRVRGGACRWCGLPYGGKKAK